jgi:hypothetical protein
MDVHEWPVGQYMVYKSSVGKAVLLLPSCKSCFLIFLSLVTDKFLVLFHPYEITGPDMVYSY